MVAVERAVTALLENEGAGAAQEAPVSRSEAVFRREGEYWTVAFEQDAFRLRHTKGLGYLAYLLASPGTEFHALDLVSAAEGRRAAPRGAGAEPGLSVTGTENADVVLDAQAKAEYRRRIEDLQAELAEAESWNDPERVARARAELDFLVAELTAAMGLGGRDRRAASASERARVNATRGIRAALTRIAGHSKALGSHLDRTVRTGTFCSYTPDPRAPITWRT
jgi:hypothetical protein